MIAMAGFVWDLLSCFTYLVFGSCSKFRAFRFDLERGREKKPKTLFFVGDFILVEFSEEPPVAVR